jgi:acyl-CoA thioester hydrolase
MSDDGVYRRTRVVQAGDLDGLGHVNNTVWVRFIVELAEAHSRAAGFDFRATRELGGLWIVRRHEIDYHASAGEGETLVEQTWVSRRRGARSIRHSRFTRRESGDLLVSATTHWAYVDPATQRPRRMHPEVLAAFAESEGPTPNEG